MESYCRNIINYFWNKHIFLLKKNKKNFNFIFWKKESKKKVLFIFSISFLYKSYFLKMNSTKTISLYTYATTRTGTHTLLQGAYPPRSPRIGRSVRCGWVARALQGTCPGCRPTGHLRHLRAPGRLGRLGAPHLLRRLRPAGGAARAPRAPLLRFPPQT